LLGIAVNLLAGNFQVERRNHNMPSIKDTLLIVVRAFNTLINSPSNNTAALATAQAQLATLQSSVTLTDAEQAEVNTALTSATAVTPPTPSQIAAVPPVGSTS
jgi:hypothetical protein